MTPETQVTLIRHGATAANLARPAVLQGRNDTPLSPIGFRQAEATRDLLADLRFDACYSSPLSRALETARVISAPHGLEPVPVEDLIECDVGRWEGRTWENIRANDADAYRVFERSPERPYAGGESFRSTFERGFAALTALISHHRGQSLLVVSHHVVCRTVLAVCLGSSVAEAKRIVLENCGVSVLIDRGDGPPLVKVLNSCFHLPADTAGA